MPRVLCVWFPKWPIQRLRHARPELRRSEIVLFAGQNQRPVITVCSAKAERLGIRSRSTAGRGQSAVAESRLPSRRSSTRTELPSVNWRSTFSASRLWSAWKRVAIPNRLLCDVTGCTHLWDGEEQISRGVRELLARARLSDPTCPGRHTGSGLGSRSYRDHLARARG